jgi:hypothetical protein
MFLSVIDEKPESAQIDPKKEVLDPNIKQRIQMFFGIENQ